MLAIETCCHGNRAFGKNCCKELTIVASLVFRWFLANESALPSVTFTELVMAQKHTWMFFLIERGSLYSRGFCLLLCMCVYKEVTEF